MIKNPRDLTGLAFGKLKVIKRMPKPEHLKKKDETYWLCHCECGNDKIIQRSGLTNKGTKSCGCLRKDNAYKKHNLSGTRFYRIWNNMKSRCYNSNIPNYEYYGARGIKVCEEWHTFESFMNDMYVEYIEHMDIHGENNTTLERLDIDRGYSKDNCKWATMEEQNYNKRNTSKPS